MNRKILKLMICSAIVMGLLAGCVSKSDQKVSLETPEEIKAVLKDYKVAGVGDSIMKGFGGNKGSFCEYLKDYGTDSKNYSAVGAGWSTDTKNMRSYKTKLAKVMNDVDQGKKYDILLLEGGMNTVSMLRDIHPEITEPAGIIGSMDELEDTSKISGMVEDNVSVVYDYFTAPGRHLFFIYPAFHEMPDEYIAYFTAYKEFMIDYCEAKDIVFIDLNVVEMEYNDTYYADNVHLTDQGYKLVSDYVAKVVAETIAAAGN